MLFGILFLGKREIIVPTTAKNTSVTFISQHKDFQEVHSLAKFHVRKICVVSGVSKNKSILRLHVRKEQNQTRIKEKYSFRFLLETGIGIYANLLICNELLCGQSGREKG